MTYRWHSLGDKVNVHVIEEKHDEQGKEAYRSQHFDHISDQLRNYSRSARVDTRTEDNPDHGRFFEGQWVKVNPETEEAKAGFTYGRVLRVGARKVVVGWYLDESVALPFSPEQIAPEEEEE